MDTTGGLVERAKDGEVDAGNAALLRTRRRLIAWVHYELGPQSPIDPDDIVQFVQMKASTSWAEFHSQGKGAFFRWQLAMARFAILDARKHRTRLVRDARREVPLSRARTPVADQTSPSAGAARTEMLSRVLAAIDDLSESHREVLRLRLIEERFHRDIAERLGVTEKAAIQRYRRALESLRGILGDWSTGFP
ncbi:MAG: sigma-70 family RNA polymerase sigma factor [Planctomycetota bacterium]|nr:sigma-70 family RNA polymerase sigma factor [Planctomycetota bacterium]